MLIRRVRQLLLAAATLLMASGICSAACTMQLMLEMPIAMVGSQPLVTVKLNGMEARLLLDTGATYSLLSPQTAKRAGLVTQAAPANLMLRGVGGSARPELTTVKDFTIGPQTLHHIQMLVYGDRLTSTGVDGILGQNFLRIGDLELDLARGSAKLFKTSACNQANLAYWNKAASEAVLAIHATSGLAPDIVSDAEVDGRKITVMFDTGSSTSNLSLRAAQQVGITPQSPDVIPGGLRYGVGAASRDSWIAPFHSFKLDSEEIRNIRLRISELDFLPEDAQMLLGADFFLSHHVFIAYGLRKVFFTYNGGPVFDLSVRATSGSASAPAVVDEPTLSATDLDLRAEASLARGEIKSAIADLNSAIAAEPGTALFHLHRGEALVRNGDAVPGQADVDEALRLQPQMTDALMFRARLRLRANNLEGARADFMAADAGAPGRLELSLEEAYAYADGGRYPIARDLLNRWLDAHPRDERRFDALAKRCLIRGMLGTELDQALSDCNTARRNASSNSQVLFGRGIVQLRRKRYDQAISDFNDTIRLQPHLARAIYARGLTRLAKGDRTGGDADLQVALALDPRTARLFRDVDLGP